MTKTTTSSFRDKAAAEAGKWRNHLMEINYLNAISLDDNAVMTMLFKESRERSKLLMFIASKLIEGANLSENWKVTKDELSTVFRSFFHIQPHEISSFINGTLLKQSQGKIWTCVFNELKMKGRLTDQIRGRYLLLNNATEITSETLKTLGIPMQTGEKRPIDGLKEDITELETLMKKAESVLNTDGPAVVELPELVQEKILSPQKVTDRFQVFYKRNEGEEPKNVDPNLNGFVKEKIDAIDLEAITGGLSNIKLCIETSKNVRECSTRMQYIIHRHESKNDTVKPS